MRRLRILLVLLAAICWMSALSASPAHATAGRCDPIQGGYLHCFTVEGRGTGWITPQPR
jgi:hypothetical protein